MYGFCFVSNHKIPIMNCNILTILCTDNRKMNWDNWLLLMLPCNCLGFVLFKVLLVKIFWTGLISMCNVATAILSLNSEVLSVVYAIFYRVQSHQPFVFLFACFKKCSVQYNSFEHGLEVDEKKEWFQYLARERNSLSWDQIIWSTA